jgi:hypothetical protein
MINEFSIFMIDLELYSNIEELKRHFNLIGYPFDNIDKIWRMKTGEEWCLKVLKIYIDSNTFHSIGYELIRYKNIVREYTTTFMEASEKIEPVRPGNHFQ